MHPVAITRSPFLDYPGSTQEHRSLDFFQCQAAPALSGYFDSQFWKDLLPRVAASEPSVRHAMIAIASLYESNVTDGKLLSHKQQSFTLTQYNKAIESLQGRLQAGQQALEITLLTCVLFICLESMRGNPDMALNHLQSGLQILNAFMKDEDIAVSDSGTRYTKPSAPDLKLILVQIFAHLSIQATLWKRRPLQTYPVKGNITIEDLGSACTPFATGYEAKRSLYRMMLQSIQPTDPHAEFDPSLPLSISQRANRQKLTAQLRYWNCRYGLLMANSLHSLNPRELRGLLVLRVTSIVALLWSLTRLIPKETAFDLHLSQFETLISIAAAVVEGNDLCPPEVVSVATSPSTGTASSTSPLISHLSAAHASSSSSFSKSSTPFTLEMGIIPSLFFTATKCRHPSVRRKAIQLLSKVVPRREGFWDARVLEKVASRMVELEEEGYAPTASMNTWPPEERRICSSHIFSKHYLEKRVQQVRFVRRPGGLEGEREVWVENIAC